MSQALLNTHVPSFDCPIAYERTMALIGNTYFAHWQQSRTFRTIVLETAQKQPFWYTKSAIKRARRLKMPRNFFVVMRLWSPVVFGYLDACFEPRFGRKDFCTACCLLLLLANMCCSPLDPKRCPKTSTG